MIELSPTNTIDISRYGQLSVQLDPSADRVTVHGEIDLATAATLAFAMTRLVDRKPRDGVIDLAGVSFIDAAGLNCFVRLSEQVAGTEAAISVAGASPRVRKVFDVVQLGWMLDAPIRGTPQFARSLR